MHELIRFDASTIIRLIREREISCVEVVEATLNQIKVTEPQVNAFASIDADGALGAARDIDTQLLTTASAAPLLGAPFSVKDLIDVRGLETGCGSWLTKGTTAAEDAVAVSRLRAAGAVCIGKTTTPEFAGSVLTESPRCGITRNPWNVRHTPGGSSGGAGAALAAGCGPLALATDGAGSARIPASCCGVLGLKPTLGRVPHPQAPDLFGNFTHLSPMTRSLPDLALMLNVLSGSDSGDPWSMVAHGNPSSQTRSFRTRGPSERLVLPTAWESKAVKAIASVCHSAITWLESEGAHIEEHDDSGLDWGIDTSRTIMRGLMSARMAQYNATQRGRMGASMRTAITQGEKMSADAMKAAPSRALIFIDKLKPCWRKSADPQPYFECTTTARGHRSCRRVRSRWSCCWRPSIRLVYLSHTVQLNRSSCHFDSNWIRRPGTAGRPAGRSEMGPGTIAVRPGQRLTREVLVG